MFEISLSNNNQSPFIFNPYRRYGYNQTLHEVVEFKNEFITINGLRYKHEKEDFYENEKYVALISGKVFYSFEFSENLYPLSAKSIVGLYIQNGKSFLENLKGNFILIIFNKLTNSLFVTKDQLALKFIYYKKDIEHFYISTNLSDFKRIPFEYNYAAVIEKILFTYPIGNESFIKDVWMLEQGFILNYSPLAFSSEIFFNIEQIFNQDGILTHFNENYFINLFEKSVLQRANVSDTNNVSLTGGFDGRTNVSILIKNNLKFLAYSFGKKGGENTKIPQDISANIGLVYYPIYLDEEFEKVYPENALDSIYFSDGISIFERANYIFALRKIASFSSSNITGLIGGEVFAPVHLKTDYINQLYFDLIYIDEKIELKKACLTETIFKYLNLNFLEENGIFEQVEENINKRRNLINVWKSEQNSWMYYMKDLMTLGFQRFYGNQMHLERYYCDNLTPFYDIDLLRYLFSTDHIKIYQNAFKNNPFLRRSNRKLQTLIINSSFSKLGEIPVDRGYPPNYILDYRKIVIPWKFYKRKCNIKKASPDFTSPAWCQILFKEKNTEIVHTKNDLFNNQLIMKNIDDYNPSNYNRDFNQLLSIAIWLSN